MADYCWQPHASSAGSQWSSENALYNQPTNMPDEARAYPRTRHTRVMKPRSAGNSPSASGRRRANVTQSVLYGPSYQYHASLEAALLASTTRDSRPISWHPSSGRTRGLSNPQYTPDVALEIYPDMGALPSQSLDTSPVYATENTNSYPLSAGPTFPPNDYFSLYSDMQNHMQIPQQTPSLPMHNSHLDSAAWDIGNVDLSSMTQTTSDGWPLDMLSMANVPPPETVCPSYASVPSPGEMSGPSTPDFLPIQKFEDASDLALAENDGKPEDELVGMGLYNQPEGALGQTQSGVLGKGLKLEETFSPSDGEDDGAAEEDLGANEPNPVPQPVVAEQLMPLAQQLTPRMLKQPSKQTLNLLHKSFFFDQDDLDRQAMTAAQPFANMNQSCMSYGYGWI